MNFCDRGSYRYEVEKNELAECVGPGSFYRIIEHNTRSKLTFECNLLCSKRTCNFWGG